MLVAMAGLPASGKSTVAQLLASELNAVLLDKDKVRAFLFEGAVDYVQQQDDLCVDVMYKVARYHLEKRPNTAVILDGRSYSKKYQVDAVKRAADQSGIALCIIECVCSAESARNRLESDAGKHIAKDRDFNLYQKSVLAADVISEPKLVIDTDKFSAAEGARLALTHLQDHGL